MARNNSHMSKEDAGSARGAHRDVVVIGGGPAGVAAAVQLKRGGTNPLIIERDRLGGLLREAHLIENYPGFPEGIAGCALADLLAAHVERAGVEVLSEEVTRLERTGEDFSIHTAAGAKAAGGVVTTKRAVPTKPVERALPAERAERALPAEGVAPVGGVVTAERVVIASGTAPNVLRGVMIFGAAAERVHYGVRDLGAVGGGRIVVIGGGDAAFDYALNLAGRNDVVILHRGERPRCIPILEERCAASSRIVYRPNAAVGEIVAAENGVILKCAFGPGAGTERVAADHVVIATGRAPRLDFVHAGIGERMEEFRKEGLLYLIGDVTNGTLRQAAISAGDGVRAAMEILERRRAAAEREPE